MDLLKTLEAGLNQDRKMAEEISALQDCRKSNKKEMIAACLNDGNLDFISLNAGKIMSEIRRYHRIG